MALLALVAGQDVEPAPDSDGRDGRWRIARTVAADRVISTVDPDTRHAHKTRARHQDGYKAHIVIEPDTGIITDTALTRAAGAHNSDAAVGIDLLTSSDTSSSTSTGTSSSASSGGGGTGFEVLADSAYGTGDALAALAAAGHHPVIKPWPLRAAVPGGLTTTAVGKALLAHEEPEALEELLARPMRRLTARSITDPAVLRAELDAVRWTGVFVECEESAVGGACVAAPVLVAGRAVAALSVSVPVHRFTPERLGPAVRTAALGLARRLSAPSRSDSLVPPSQTEVRTPRSGRAAGGRPT